MKIRPIKVRVVLSEKYRSNGTPQLRKATIGDASHYYLGEIVNPNKGVYSALEFEDRYPLTNPTPAEYDKEEGFDCVVIEEKEYERLLAYNKGLDNIIRVNANKERGLHPKNKHSGIVMLSSEQSTYRKKNGKHIDCWVTKIQTPYKLSEFTSAGLMSDRTKLVEKIYNATGLIIEKEFYEDEIKRGQIEIQNDVYTFLFSANYKSNYWEIKIYHQNEIAYIIEDEYR